MAAAKQPKKRGRPPGPPEEKFNITLAVKLKDEHYALIAAAAKLAGKGPSTFVREAALAAATRKSSRRKP